MDDQQNQNIQPAPSAPPIDITPPMTPPVTPPIPPVVPVPPVENIAPPVMPVPEPISSPVPEPVTVPAPEPFQAPSPAPVTPEPTVAEPPMPETKTKKKIVPIIGAIVALFLVVGVAGAAYYVSNQLSTRQAVAPNAPESKPSATEGICADGSSSECEGKSVGTPCSGGTVCTVTGDDMCSCVCPVNECDTEGATFCGTSTNTIWECHLWGGGCPGGYNQNTGTACDSDGGGGGDGGGTPVACTRDLGSGVAGSCYETRDNSTVACKNPGTWGYECGTECCNFASATVTAAVCCCTGCYPAGTDCSQHECNTCTVSSWTPDPATVCAGTTFTQTSNCETTRDSTGTKVCTCVPTEGSLVCNPDCPTVCGTAKSTISSCTNSCGATTKECAATADCETGGECTLLNVYKKVNGVYGTTPLTHDQLIALKVGDILRLSWTGSIDNLKGRVRATISTTPTNSTVGDWLTGQLDATNKKLFTYDGYTITVAGTYNFEAQVSTTP